MASLHSTKSIYFLEMWQNIRGNYLLNSSPEMLSCLLSPTMKVLLLQESVPTKMSNIDLKLTWKNLVTYPLTADLSPKTAAHFRTLK